MRSRASLAAVPFVVLVASVAPSPALAQSGSDPVAARTLFQDARKLVAEKKYDQACPKFEESLKLDPGIGTMFNLADCWEHVGKTASAWSRFLDAASAARNSGQSERERVARDRAAAIEPHLSRMVVTVAAPDPGLQVLDGTRAVGASLYGVSVPVDPGAHTISASAPGKKRWESTVQVGADAAQVSVSVPALVVDPTAQTVAPATTAVASAAPIPGEAPAAKGLPDTPPAPVSASGTTQRTIGWVTAGVGLVGVGVGIAFGFATQSKNSDAKALCANLTCADQKQLDDHTSLVSQAKGDRTGSIIGFAAGGAALAGGLVIVLTAPHGHVASKEGALRLVPIAGPGTAGASVDGSF
jgi:serine/threonine-protein kinase